MGLLIAARIRSMEGFQMIGNLVLIPMFVLSGALFPLNNLPSWLTILTRVNPLSYAVDAARQVVLPGAGVPGTAVAYVGVSLAGRPLGLLEDLALVAAFGGLMIALAARAFSIKE